MRIAYPTSEFVSENKNFSGGLANYLYRLLLHLKNVGHEPVIIVSSDRNETINFNGIAVYRVKLFPKYWYRFLNRITFRIFAPALYEILQSWWLNQKIKELHKERPFDIIQYPSYMSVGFFRNRKIPSVLRISSIIKLWHQADEYNCEALQLKQIYWLENFVFRHANQIFGPCEMINKTAEQISNKKVKLIETPFYNEILANDETIVNQIKISTNNNPYLLYFGTIAVYKGLLEISEVIQNILSQFPDLYFVFIGKSSDYKGISMIELIKKQAGNHADHTIFLNPIKHEQLYPIINASLAVVLPSRVDNLPNTAIEAMALGKVVIGTYEGGFQQFIEDGKSGFLFQNSKPETLFEKIKQTMQLSDSQKNEIEESAKNRITKLKPEIVINQLLEYYKTIIN